MITNTDRQTLARYFAAQPVDAVYLFGSQATGKPNRLSDIDVAVLFSEQVNDQERFDIRLTMMSDIGTMTKHPDAADVIDLERVPLGFQYQALIHRTVVFVRNQERMKRFEMSTIKKYLDMRPMLASVAKRKIALLAQKGFTHDRR